MRHIIAVALGATTLALGAAPGQAQEEAAPDPGAIDLQEAFDDIGAEVHALDHEGRTLHYIDEGEPGDRAVVFIGGLGTSLAAFQLTEFARSTREALGLRAVSVERNGFGESAFDPALGYADYAEEVLAVLDHLGIGDFAILAISGGGAYATHLAAAAPERVISLHAAAAVPWTLPTRDEPDCSRTLEQANAENLQWTQHPKDWWGVPGSPVLVIPGWQAAAYADATRSFYLGGQVGDPTALSHEWRMLPCAEGAVAEVARITAPVYLYWGEADESVPVADMEKWQAALPNVARATVYPGEGHTVQYRHWDQILADMAGYGDHTVVCQDGETRLVPAAEAGDLPLGLCAWTAQP